jgi:hypothetical protein
MKKMYLMVFLLLPVLTARAHPLHLSITNITYENGRLGISMKTFLKDWETAYFHYHSDTIDFDNPANREIPWFRDYLHRSFYLAPGEGKEAIALELDSLDYENDFAVLHLHGEVHGDPESLYIYNALLTDIYPDQSNLVIFGFQNKETGIKFDVLKHGSMVMLK